MRSSAILAKQHAGRMLIAAILQAMTAMNKQMNLPALQNIMREFEKQNERMEMTSEVMGDAIDDAFEVSLQPAMSPLGHIRMISGLQRAGLLQSCPCSRRWCSACT